MQEERTMPQPASASRRSMRPVETIAEGFATIGLSRCAPLLPLSTDNGDDPVLANLCLVTANEELPNGFEPVWSTVCGKKAILNASNGV